LYGAYCRLLVRHVLNTTVASKFRHPNHPGTVVPCAPLTKSGRWGVAEQVIHASEFSEHALYEDSSLLTGLAEQGLGVWLSQPPPQLLTSQPQPVAAFDFDETLASCSNNSGDANEWQFLRAEGGRGELPTSSPTNTLHTPYNA
jgi:hypothetical protein